MAHNIAEKIKKLLRLAQANSGATEAEAAAAMEMAAALMTKHNIEVSLDDDLPKGARQGDMKPGYDEDWHYQCANAVSTLYSLRYLFKRRAGLIGFVGRPDNIEAAHILLDFLIGEVERQYKLNLPRGMTKADRANYRKTFKFACARRLAERAWAIIDTLRRDDTRALAQTGSTALVVVQSIDQMLAEADELIRGMTNIRQVRLTRPRATGLGTLQGRRAGDNIKLNQQLG